MRTRCKVCLQHEKSSTDGSDENTTIGRLLFVLGVLHEREPDNSIREAERIGKSSFAIPFNVHRQKEREQGIIACNTPDMPANSETEDFTFVDMSTVARTTPLEINSLSWEVLLKASLKG